MYRMTWTHGLTVLQIKGRTDRETGFNDTLENPVETVVIVPIVAATSPTLVGALPLRQSCLAGPGLASAWKKGQIRNSIDNLCPSFKITDLSYK